MRAFLTISAMALSALAADAQVQERKLLDRLLKPDMSLQNRAQDKQFTPGGATLGRQARTKSFRVADRRPEKQLRANRTFTAKDFTAARSRYGAKEAKLPSSPRIAGLDVPYSTPNDAAASRVAPDGAKSVETSGFSETRPFLVRGKSQKALSAQDRPLTIDQVRELLNKNE